MEILILANVISPDLHSCYSYGYHKSRYCRATGSLIDLPFLTQLDVILLYGKSSVECHLGVRQLYYLRESNYDCRSPH